MILHGFSASNYYNVVKLALLAVAIEVRHAVHNGARALRKLARFDRFLSGDRFTAADIAGAMHFPAVRRVTETVLNCDPLGDIPGLSEYVERMNERPAVRLVREDREKIFPEFIAYMRSRFFASPVTPRS